MEHLWSAAHGFQILLPFGDVSFDNGARRPIVNINKTGKSIKRGMVGSLGAILLIVGVPAALQMTSTDAAGAATPGCPACGHTEPARGHTGPASFYTNGGIDGTGLDVPGGRRVLHDF